jgi:hypothetical protein
LRRACGFNPACNWPLQDRVNKSANSWYEVTLTQGKQANRDMFESVATLFPSCGVFASVSYK